ncbi:MAG: hypothetical protein Q8O64_04025 [Sideroxyarcus sp.]|nr:hypothetical protein [Sideroxyarcus sp.]
MARTLLFLSAETFQAHVRQRDGSAVVHEFSNDADGRGQFDALLEQHRHPLLLLVDIIEEDFHLESIPHLIGPSRRALIDRKFEQYYRTTPFRQATLVKRQSEGRRDDEYLFSALTNPQRISPWLDILHAHKIPLVGIYSVPNISASLLEGIESEHILLLTWGKLAGLRQTYFHNKRLLFSRLIPIAGDATLIDAISAETPRTQQYLKSLSLPPAGEVLDVYILCHAGDKAQLQTLLENERDLNLHYLDLNEFAQRNKCKHEFIDSDSTLLLLDQLARKTPAAHYGSAAHTHYYLLWQLRRIIYVLAATIALGGLLWSALAYLQGDQHVRKAEPILQQTADVRAQTQGIQRQFSNTSVPAADMKAAVLLARSLTLYSRPPQEILFELSAVLDDFPRIGVGKLAWQVSAADAPPSPYPAQVITFDGMVTGFGTGHRRALEYLDRFQQALVQHGYAVTATALPLDVSSKGSISEEASSEANQGQFTLKIIWRNPS